MKYCVKKESAALLKLGECSIRVFHPGDCSIRVYQSYFHEVFENCLALY